MADEKLPWYERRPVLGGTVSTTVIALLVLFAGPFVDKTWPSHVAAFLSAPWVRGILGLFALGGTGFGGYTLGRRKRPYSGPLFTLDLQPSLGPVAQPQEDVLMLPPTPPRDEEKATWDDLGDEERRLLVSMWRSEDTFVSDDHLDALRRLFHWDAKHWNAMKHSLAERQRLVEQATGFKDDAKRHYGDGWHLTKKGERLLASAAKRGEAELPPAPPGPWKPGNPY